jgi:hypothetical protein
MVPLPFGVAYGILSASNAGTDFSGKQQPWWGESVPARAVDRTNPPAAESRRGGFCVPTRGVGWQGLNWK